MTNLYSILKSRDITLPTKVRLTKAMVFPVVMYGCESQTIKKAECQRIDAFELWCWRRLLRVPWTARRSKQSILKETSPEYSLEGLMLKLKLQYFDCLMQTADWLIWKDPDSGKDWGYEEKGTTENEMVGWHHRLNGHGWTLGVGDRQGGLVCCSSRGRKESDTTEQLNWTELNWTVTAWGSPRPVRSGEWGTITRPVGQRQNKTVLHKRNKLDRVVLSSATFTLLFKQNQQWL